MMIAGAIAALLILPIAMYSLVISMKSFQISASSAITDNSPVAIGNLTNYNYATFAGKAAIYRVEYSYVVNNASYDGSGFVPASSIGLNNNVIFGKNKDKADVLGTKLKVRYSESSSKISLPADSNVSPTGAKLAISFCGLLILYILSLIISGFLWIKTRKERFASFFVLTFIFGLIILFFFYYFLTGGGGGSSGIF